MRIVYTAIFGRYDELKDPLVISEGVRYICFTDQVLNSKVWELVMVRGKWDSVRNARDVKTLFHKYVPNFTEAMWIDANQQINVDVNMLFNEFDAELNILKHPNRNCIFDEARACLNMRKDSPETIGRMMQQLDAEKYPTQNGLVATGLMIRRNTNGVNDFMERWFEKILFGSRRDQLSFNYINWRKPLKSLRIMDWEILKSNFIQCKHTNK